MGQLACKLEVGERAGSALPDVRSMLASAVARHKAGDAAAGDLYRAILSAEPSHGDVLHLLGVTALQAGTAEVASGWLRRALVIDGAQAYYRNSLGEALRALGRPNEAREQYRLALTLSPAYPESLANLLRQPQPGDNASALLERFCRLRLAGASEILAVADSRLLSGRLADANLAYRAAVALEPATVQAYVNLGATASREKHYAQAATAFRRALRLSPDHPGAWNNLASAVWELNDGQGAVGFCRRSVALKPDHPDPYANLGYVQRSQAQNGDDFAEAATLCRRALQINPSHVSALNNLGIVNLDLGHLDEAERLFRRTLDAEPKHPDARFNLSLALLKAGRLKEGWGFYEARWETGQLPMVNAQLRAWQGEPLNGATILLHAEQGHGDTLHFVRYAPLVAALGGRVVLAVQPALKRLVAGMPGVAAVHALTDAFPAPDFHCPLMSLPRLLGTELGTIPSGIPYLYPPAEAIGKWLGQPLPGAGLRVGLVWSGDPRPGLLRANLTDRRRSMTLRDLAPLAEVPNLRFVNLQMGGPAAQLADPPTGMDIHDPMGAVTDFADTAALVLRLDLVITVDTSVAHLVGALGKPVWVLSRYDGCWRWLQDRDDTPWYPTMRLFRQIKPGDWTSVVEQVAEELATLSRGEHKPPAPRAALPASPRAERDGTAAGRLALPDVTLVCADTRTPQASLWALERCRAQGDFARVLFFTDAPVRAPGIDCVSIPKLEGHAAYSRFMLKDLLHHIDTPLALVVQWDGFIVDPSRWREEFRRYDYIGARWPWHQDGLQVGNGGFSLRSRRLLEALQDPQIVDLEIEDVSIGRIYRRLLEDEHGIVFAPNAVADRFAYERLDPTEPTFGFHGLFNVWRHLAPTDLAALLAELPPSVLAGREALELAHALTAAGRGDEAKPLRPAPKPVPAPAPPPSWRPGSPGKIRPVVLFVSNRTPRPDEDSGSADAYNTMKALRELGFEVVFFAWEHPVHEGRYTEALDALGIQSLCAPDVTDLAAWLRVYGCNLSAAIVCRVQVASECLAQVKAHAPQAKIVFNTVDLHFLRERRQAELQNSPERKALADKLRETELGIVASADATIVVSSVEAELLASLVPQARVCQIPIFREIPGRSAPFQARKDIIFIGGFQHQPNVDAIIYFINEIWPLVRAELQGVKLHIVGSNMPSALAGLEPLDIVGHGHVADVADIFGHCRLSVAPLRFGAGQKGKVVTSLSYGVPVVATTVAIEGMGFQDPGPVRIGDTPQSFAKAVVEFYRNEDDWQRCSDDGIAHAASHFGYDVGKQAIRDLFDGLLAADAPTVSGFLSALTETVARENRGGRFPPLRSFSKPLVLDLVRAAREMTGPRSASAFDLLLAAIERCNHWFLKLAACRVALDEGRRDLALVLAETAMGQMQGDLYAQELWMLGKDADTAGSHLAAIDEDLRGRFCDRPFKWMEFTNNATWVCCSSWLPVPIGPAPARPEEVWNGAVAQELRRSILDGSFRYCSRVHCPWISKKSLPRREDMALDQYQPVMPPPTMLNLCYDDSCNLSCPSCRKQIYVAEKPQQDALGSFYETAVAPLGPTAKTVNVTGSGDPFASHHFRWVLKQLTATDGPTIDIQTNGVLFDERAWRDLSLKGKVRRIWVSLDAAKIETYKKVRRDGDFERARTNVRRIVERRRARGIEFIGLDFVVQDDNLGEMLEFIAFGIETGVDSVRFNMIRNWGTFSNEEFEEKCVGSGKHPRYDEFLSILADPLFDHPIVDAGNLWQFADRPSKPAGSRDRDVLHT